MSYQSSDWDLHYTYFDGNDWTDETLLGSSGSGTNWGVHSSIALDSRDYPQISHAYYYRERTNEGGVIYINEEMVLRMEFFNGSSWDQYHYSSLGWEYQGMDGFYSSIAIDSNGAAHISFAGAYFNDQGNRLSYWKYDDGQWDGTMDIHETSSNDFGAYTGMYTSVAVDSSDAPHISYVADGILKYAYNDGTEWHIQTVDDRGWFGWYSSLALDSQDQPHIAYYDYLNKDLLYAFLPSNDIFLPLVIRE
jgi:hypothetical protein